MCIIKQILSKRAPGNYLPVCFSKNSILLTRKLIELEINHLKFCSLDKQIKNSIKTSLTCKK